MGRARIPLVWDAVRGIKETCQEKIAVPLGDGSQLGLALFQASAENAWKTLRRMTSARRPKRWRALLGGGRRGLEAARLVSAARPSTALGEGHGAQDGGEGDWSEGGRRVRRTRKVGGGRMSP